MLISYWEYDKGRVYSHIIQLVPVGRNDSKNGFQEVLNDSFESKRNITYKDMFHIPLSKRGMASTQRYSVPGYPCLYMGESAYACWEELERPDLDSCMVLVGSQEDKFKPEYIIPQLLMEFILWENFGKIPLGIVDNCPTLRQLFKITNPTCDEYEQIKGNKGKCKGKKTGSDAERIINYEKTIFSTIESSLKDESKFPLNQMPI